MNEHINRLLLNSYACGYNNIKEDVKTKIKTHIKECPQCKKTFLSMLLKDISIEAIDHLQDGAEVKDGLMDIREASRTISFIDCESQSLANKELRKAVEKYAEQSHPNDNLLQDNLKCEIDSMLTKLDRKMETLIAEGKPTFADMFAKREKDILSLIGKGLGFQEISKILTLPEKVILCYVGLIRKKLEVFDTDSLVQTAKKVNRFFASNPQLGF